MNFTDRLIMIYRYDDDDVRVREQFLPVFIFKKAKTPTSGKDSTQDSSAIERKH